ncbi:unnamed protein product [Calicophoron daubneyi]|uniref:Phosphatidic acid phosphatase type 2/haloperoxidase domain-containing protein n=1 Tax=Calicophoron daubneyi TaxID=300641 RepID=A0AAV2TE82_CALDB
MSTLPSNRSVNTFQNPAVRRSSISGLRHPRSSSLYLPEHEHEQDDESRSQLLPNEPYQQDRRAQTLGRPNQSGARSHNLTNPLFDSAGSLDQPWYRSYGQSVTLSPPTISLPIRPLDNSTFATAREMQTSIRVPSTRLSPTRMSMAYSTGHRISDRGGPRSCCDTVPQQGCGAGCMGLTCCQPETKWSDWIPLHHRTFRCPALPPGQDEDTIDTNNPWLRELLASSELIPTTPAYGVPPSIRQPRPASKEGGRKGSKNDYSGHDAWDADLGLMPPPQLTPYTPEERFGPTTTRLYGPTYDKNDEPWGRHSDKWMRLNPAAPYSDVPTESIMIGSIIVPLLLIVVIEITAACLSCCQSQTNKRGQQSMFARRLFARLYRLSVSYIFGLLTIILLTCILKASIGRLRPDFIKICRPSPNVCPRWATILREAGYGFDWNDRSVFASNPNLLRLLAQESAKQGYYLVPKTTTPNPSLRGSNPQSGFLTDSDCMEKNVLRLKYARTSFPSMSASVAMYATVFVAAYITYSLRNLRMTCFCIPLTLLVGSCLTNVFLGLGRMVHRQNWLEDILAGWILGIIIAAYVLYRALGGRKEEKSVSSAEIHRQLRRLQEMIQSNSEYKQNEIKLMKYL